MVGKLWKRGKIEDPYLHLLYLNLKSYEFIPHAGIIYMLDLTPHLRHSMSIVLGMYRNVRC